MFLSITGLFVGIGLLCLNLDLGNRIFGSYRRTVLGTVVRIIFIVLINIVFLLPLLFSSFFMDSEIISYLYIFCFLLSGTVIVIYLFPPKRGILPFKSPLIKDNLPNTSLIPEILLHYESISADFPLKKDFLQFLILSDLHCNSMRKLDMLTKAIKELEAQEYDAVFILGDLTERKNILPPLFQRLSEIKNRYGIFCVRGNHDYEGNRSDTIKELAQKQAVTILSNQSFYVPELEITLIGLEYPWYKIQLPGRIQGFAVGLSHTPDNIKLFHQLGVAVAVAGHTHGGKFHLPFLGPILVPSRYGRFLCRGWFQFQNTLQYITSGIGYFPGQTGEKGEILQLTIIQKKDK